MTRGVLACLCFVLGVLAVPAVGFLYLHFGRVPVAVSDPAFPMEQQIVHTPLERRIEREMPHTVPLQPTPEVLVAGASIYKEHCAFCHGLPQHDSTIARHTYPPVPQLWKAHGHGVVGVSDDAVGETFWKVRNGIRLTGMPAYADILSQEQMWQVSLLLSKANQPLPGEAQRLLAP